MPNAIRSCVSAGFVAGSARLGQLSMPQVSARVDPHGVGAARRVRNQKLGSQLNEFVDDVFLSKEGLLRQL